nr:MAG TPA: hyaluronidase [Caudoviricetes sp.]
MATTTFNIRIVLRNDSTAKWLENKDQVLLKGELGVEFEADGGVKIKIGDGAKTWEQLEYFGGASAAQVFQAESADAAGDIAAITTAVGDAKLQSGDFAIVSHDIDGTHKSYTAYVYDGKNWKAMDGNYDASNVYFGDNITMAGSYSQIGNLTKTQNGTATFAVKGKSVAEAFTQIFSKRLQPGAPTQPSVSLTFSQAKAYEVGTTVTPTWSATLSTGSYTYGPATGITATAWEISDTAGNTATTASGSFDAITVADGTNYKITAKATHGAGAVANDNLGSPSSPEVKIAAGSKSKTSDAITGYRNTFYGTKTTKDTLDSAAIRSLSNKSNTAWANGKSFTVQIPVGAVRVVFAYPATLRDVNSVKDVNGLNAEIKSAFAKSTIAVEGANGATAIDYKVYTTDFAEPVAKANSYTITI